MLLCTSLKGIIPLDRFEIYGIGGIGAYINRGEGPTFSPGISGIGSRVSFSDTDVAFGGYLGAGVNFNITNTFFLGVEGKYLWTKANFESTLNGYNLKLDVDIRGFIVTGNLGVRF